MKAIRETEKALQFESTVYMEVAPKGGFVSSLIKDRMGKWTFWCPKSVVKDGVIADWFMSKIESEAREYYAYRFYDAQILSLSINVL
mgnify:CR=1 FL=1